MKNKKRIKPTVATRRRTIKLEPSTIRARCLYVRKKILKMSEYEAAQLMEYTNTTQISKMESVTSSSAISHNYLLRLAYASGVSLDFLYGRTRVEELAEQGVSQLLLYQQFKDKMHETIEIVAKDLATFSQQEQLGWCIEQIKKQGDQFQSTFQKFLVANHEEFQDLRIGNKLCFDHQQLVESINRANGELERQALKKSHQLERLQDAIVEEESSRQLDYIGRA